MAEVKLPGCWALWILQGSIVRNATWMFCVLNLGNGWGTGSHLWVQIASEDAVVIGARLKARLCLQRRVQDQICHLAAPSPWGHFESQCQDIGGWESCNLFNSVRESVRCLMKPLSGVRVSILFMRLQEGGCWWKCIDFFSCLYRMGQKHGITLLDPIKITC